MIVFHGTTAKRAAKICVDGFLPKKPSKRVWFAESWSYAEGRGRTQARRSRDRHVVLTCDLDLIQLRHALGQKRVLHRRRVISIQGAVPVSVLRTWPAAVDTASSPVELASWINGILRTKQHKGVSPKHKGVQRLSRWVINRLRQQPNNRISPTEILDNARRWLPEFLGDVEIDPATLHVRPRTRTVEVKIEYPDPAGDERQYEALELLEADKPKQRIRGLQLLAKLEDADLFEWCAMLLDDESVEVQVAALKTITHCEDADPDTIAPFAESEDKRIRAVAIAALAKHSGDAAPLWFRRGLTDPCPNVRLEMVSLLPLLDPAEHKELFELALYDPNTHVQQRAERMTQGKGYAKPKW
ncbi:MAG: hypothetical protein QGH75_03985 [Pseudomonadales bacterium]|jgi:hypothetical protein|nr:hypothetical protein [Pseudomonadales bacterium]HJN50408.1 hypothetical protein [Pseudomonadales bacterium]|tara:strand:+ start:8807 stop:9877 length:1071 start_codon:yes stop_codon:yes gene_type:complete